jgi:predicted MPP superfamily phosphohydrolase
MNEIGDLDHEERMTNTLARAPQIRIICVIACIVALLLGCNRGVQNKEAAPSAHTAGGIADIEVGDPKPYPFRFVAYGDMRFAELESYGKVIANAKARQEIIDQIANESPAFLVATGDFVFRGFHAEDWSHFDKAIQPLRDRGVRIFPAIGNHEVGPFPPLSSNSNPFQEIESETKEKVAARGLENYYREFSSIPKNPWYSVRYANCYFLILDSELDDEKSNAAQEQWITAQLKSMPSEIDHIFVVLHRPPYTAFTDAVHKPQPPQVALAQLVERHQQGSRAHIIVVAGHVHNYERYQRGRVDYIVSGGGGAEPVRFADSGTEGTHRATDDLYSKNALYGKTDSASADQYHYCLFTVDHLKLKFQMMKLVSKGLGFAFEPRDSFEVNVTGLN